MFAQALERLPSEPQQIDNSEYRNRQMNFYSNLEHSDIFILPAPKEATHSNDVHYRYRTSSDFLYLTGWIEPEAVLVARFDDSMKKWLTILFVQPKNTLMEIWEGRRPGVQGALEHFPIDKAYSIEELNSKLNEYLRDSKRVLLRTGVIDEIDDIVTKAIQKRDRNRQHFGTGPISTVDPSPLLAELRLIKSSSEIAQMRYAAQVSSLAHELAMRLQQPELNERHLQSIIEGFFTYANCSGWSYPSIVGCGENATILHYRANNAQCGDDEVVLIDAGSEYRGYAADITRSWPISGKFSDAQKELYKIVLESQKAAIKQCVVGNLYTAPHDAARRVLAQGLIDLGIINQTIEEALDIETGELKKWYMHNTSHWIGLDVHDVGVYKPDGSPRRLEAGMVLTIEPGLYFGAWRPDVDCPERYANIGIRIEDDVLITEEGPDVLTRDCPKEIEELEAIIGQGI